MPESVEELADKDGKQYRKMLKKLNGRAEPYGFYYTTLFMWPGKQEKRLINSLTDFSNYL